MQITERGEQKLHPKTNLILFGLKKASDHILHFNARGLLYMKIGPRCLPNDKGKSEKKNLCQLGIQRGLIIIK